MSQNVDSIEKLLKNGRPAPQPEHSFHIFFEGSEPKLIDVAQLERDAKEYQKNIYEPVTVTDYKVLASKFGGKCVKLGGGGSTFDPCMEISKLPDEEKDKLTAEAIKIIEKREEERKR